MEALKNLTLAMDILAILFIIIVGVFLILIMSKGNETKIKLKIESVLFIAVMVLTALLVACSAAIIFSSGNAIKELEKTTLEIFKNLFTTVYC